ncbi:putative translation initiation factor IF-2, partial [Cardiosporidium cionae]
GLGVTIDVILLNGTLHEGDTIVVCGMSGPIVSTIRALLTPQPMQELRVKNEYIHHPEIEAAMGIKIAAQGLDEAVAGTSLLIAENFEKLDELKEEVMEDMVDIFKSVDRSGCGVYVMASTLGSLEALLEFLKGSKIPVFGVNIGRFCIGFLVMRKEEKELGSKQRSECIYMYDDTERVEQTDLEAEKEAAILGVKILSADIIYHLFDDFTKFIHDFNEEKKVLILSFCTISLLFLLLCSSI